MTTRNQRGPTYSGLKLVVFAFGLELLGIIFTFAGPTHSGPAPLEAPKGPVLLTVTGKITHKNRGEAAVFDLEMLEGLERGVISTTNPWMAGTNDFSGPYLSVLLKAVGATGTNSLMVTALNDFVGSVPQEDIAKFGLILATRKNGKPLKVREKGPLFVVYPFLQRPEIYDEIHFCRSVWQIKSIEIR